MTGIHLSRCRSCGAVHFPRRDACPRCHRDDLTAAPARHGVIEELTTTGERTLASVRTELGPIVVASFPAGAQVEPGDEVRLTSTPDTSSPEPVAYVPDPAAGQAVLPLPFARQTLPALLERQAERYGDKPLVRVGDVVLSYREVRDAAARTAGMLTAAGLRRGDRVATLSGNRLELLDLMLGCAWLGVIVVPLNVAVRGDGLRHGLANSGARVLVLEPELLDVLDHVDAPGTLEQVWLFPGSEGARQPRRPYPVRPIPAAGDPVPAADVRPGDTAVILYTSGTTGLPKGVCCPHAQLYWYGVIVGDHLTIGEDDVLFTVLPLFHMNALTAFVQALINGATFVLGARFSASRFWTEATATGATVTYLLGAMINILYRREPGEHDRAHRIRIALSPATPANLHIPFRERFGITLLEGYGSTETNMTISAPAGRQRPGYLGKVLPGFDARVVDEQDQPVPDGTPGELILRHTEPFSFATGYFAMPEKTVEAWRNLWFHTGDRVVRDADGWYRFLDRIKDAIRRRGENISSFEVEQAIAQHPAVAQVAVYAVPSEMAEDEVMACIVPRPGSALPPEDLIAFLRPRLARFALPRYIRFAETLPMTENGKIRKVVLRETGITPGTWDATASPPR
ncbi:ATP-dependent acyl-CoA ligase [Amycolatopsis anabasis]|uniref:ATP-dependent acyl-CoA ligase n=1 Tax=Amycolatopsis anabasis TaxID=1840409 RepID=UPI00131D96F7|nr:ATP-dependent acyl-CoA ligase [Amycolatopsis anabasis]